MHSITGYSTKSAILTLEHNFPPGNAIKALVDVELLLSTLKSNETQLGEWVNVIGYVRSQQQYRLRNFSDIVILHISVQAIVLWSSGPLKLDEYERSLEQQNLPESLKP